MNSRTNYADGTWIEQRYPWGLHVKAAAVCPDGKVRCTSRIAETADTFFSVPASIQYKGKTVAGFITVETREGLSTESDRDPAVVKFVPYQYGKHGGIFGTAGPFRVPESD